MQEFTRAMAAAVVTPRQPHTHKGDYGHVLIVAGDANMGGAAIMSARAAVEAGAGLVTVATAAVNHTALHSQLPEAMVLTWDDTELVHHIMHATVIVIGPGLGTTAAAKQVLALVLDRARTEQTLIIDGSAITLIAAHRPQLPASAIIWTPHQMEWQRLSGIPIANQTVARNQAAALKLTGTVVLKGSPTITIAPTGCFQNVAGTPAMATGGSGDTLTGILAAFCAQFGHTTNVIAAAVWVHSSAAMILAADAYVVRPTAISSYVPRLMAALSREN